MAYLRKKCVNILDEGMLFFIYLPMTLSHSAKRQIRQRWEVLKRNNIL